MTNLTIRRFEFQYLAGRVLLHLSFYLGEKGREIEEEREIESIRERHRRDEKGEKLMENGDKGEGVRQIGMGLKGRG